MERVVVGPKPVPTARGVPLGALVLMSGPESVLRVHVYYLIGRQMSLMSGDVWVELDIDSSRELFDLAMRPFMNQLEEGR